MKWLSACCLAVAPMFGAAAQGPVPPVGDDDLLAYLGNMRIEARLDADVTGDRIDDVVYVASSAHERAVGVIDGGGPALRIGRRSIGEGTLDLSPQVPVVLDFTDGILTVEDLTGTEGTDSVTLSRYQYRHDPGQNRMRLFALVCEQYSPTLSHGSRRMSWNLDSGVQVVEHGRVVTLDSGEDVYVYESGQRSNRHSAAVYMENAPRPTDVILAGASPRKRLAADRAKPGEPVP